MQRPDSEVVALGEFAKAFLTNETFNTIYKEYTDLMLNSIITSEPHELKKREFEYAKAQAIIGFVNHLTGYAVAAENIIQQSTEQSDED